jgi:hypothetical protein
VLWTPRAAVQQAIEAPADMTDLPTPDPTEQAPEYLQTSLPGYPDTRIAWRAATPARAAYANNARFVVEDNGSPFVFAWEFAVLAVEDIDSATVGILARGDVDRNGVEVALQTIKPPPPGALPAIPIGDADRLIERWRAFARGVETGVVFHQVGHPPEPDILHDTYMAAWREIRPQYQRRGLVKALAARLSVHENTIRNYHDKYGWPLYEEPERAE